MTEVEIFNTLYGKLGLFGILCLVIWKVYRDMKSDRVALIIKIEAVEKKYEEYIKDDHERVMKTLQGTNSSREKLADTLNRLCLATEQLPCNQSQPVGHRWVTPTHDAPTPSEGNKV